MCITLCLHYIFLGLQRIHHPCNESVERAVPDTARLTKRDRENGEHHSPQVQLHPNAAQAEHL